MDVDVAALGLIELGLVAPASKDAPLNQANKEAILLPSLCVWI